MNQFIIVIRDKTRQNILITLLSEVAETPLNIAPKGRKKLEHLGLRTYINKKQAITQSMLSNVYL